MSTDHLHRPCWLTLNLNYIPPWVGAGNIETYEVDYSHGMVQRCKDANILIRHLKVPRMFIVDGESLTPELAAEKIGITVSGLKEKIRDGAIDINGHTLDVDLEGLQELFRVHQEKIAREKEEREELLHQARVKRLAEAKARKASNESLQRARNLANKKNYQVRKIDRLKALCSFEVGSESIGLGLGRYYLDGVRVTREEASKILGIHETFLKKLVAIGNFTYQGRKLEVRNVVKEITPPKAKLVRVPKPKPEKKPRLVSTSEERRQKDILRKRLAQEKKNAEKLAKGLKVHYCPHREYEITPFPEPKVFSNRSIYTLDGEIVVYETILKKFNATNTFFDDKLKKGIMKLEGHLIERRERTVHDCPPPKIRPYSTQKMYVGVNFMNKRYVFFTGTKENCEKYLENILKDDKWKEKLLTVGSD